MEKIEAVYFDRDDEWNFVVSSEKWAYLTTTTEKDKLMDNPWYAENIYWDITDKVKFKAQSILNRRRILNKKK